MMRRLRTVTHQDCCPHSPLPPSISRTGRDTATRRFLVTLMSLIPAFQVRSLSQRCTTRPWHRSLLNCESENRPWRGFATHLRWKRLRQAHGRLLLSLCQKPVDTAIQASLTRRNHILETVKERELLSPGLMMLPGNGIKHTC